MAKNGPNIRQRNNVTTSDSRKELQKKNKSSQNKHNTPKLKSNSDTGGLLFPGGDTAFKALLSARFCSAIWCHITDCDETFNYWEPLHFLDFTIYDVQTRSPIKFELASDQLRFRKTLYYLGRSNGCTCQDLTCGCCAGFNITQFNFDREGCMNFTYRPCKFDITMNMLWNEESVYTNKFSAQNPPPLCMPIPVPYIPQAQIEFCVKMFNIHMPGQNLNMCMDMEMRVQRQPLVVLHFNCMRFGQDGVALTRPDSECPLTSSEASNEEESTSQPAANIFDPVTETKI